MPALTASPLLLAGCLGGLFGGQDTAVQDTAGGGSGYPDTWRARGEGQAWLLDGEQAHSLFTLELDGTMAPREGESYHGWLRNGDRGDVYLGEIPERDGQVSFSAELGFNGLEAGYRTFEAYAAASTPSAPGEGDALWKGEMSEEALQIVSELLISSPSTPDGEGSLRSTQYAAEAIRDFAQTASEDLSETSDFWRAGEAVYNAIDGGSEDLDHDGRATGIDGVEMGLIGEGGHVEMLLGDLDEVYEAFGAEEADIDVRRTIGDAHDCVDRVEQYALQAQTEASLTTVCGHPGSCATTMAEAAERLTRTLVGYDEDQDGVIDVEKEGTIDCGIEYVSRLVAFSVGTAGR